MNIIVRQKSEKALLFLSCYCFDNQSFIESEEEEAPTCSQRLLCLLYALCVSLQIK